MALSIPNRFVNAQTIDAAKFNSNFDAITAWGVTTDATLTSDAATIAANGTILANIGKGAFFAIQPASALVVTSNTTTTITADDSLTDCFDTSGWFNKATSIYTPLVAGAYQFNINVNTNSATAGHYIGLYVRKNTNQIPLQQIYTTTANAGISASVILKANGSTDTFKFEIYSTDTNVTLVWVTMSGCCVRPD